MAMRLGLRRHGRRVRLDGAAQLERDAVALRRSALPATIDELADRCGDARVVLLGESTHGTHEFYALRAALSLRLLDRHGFAALAVEADWSSARPLDRYIRRQGADRSADEALAGFTRFPRWMWRNSVIRELVEDLRAMNATRTSAERIRLFGLDLYSMFASMTSVVEHLDPLDPDAAEAARRRYACFDVFGGDAQRYGLLATGDATPVCRDAVLAQLQEMEARRQVAPSKLHDEAFLAEQDARVAANAERYYRDLYLGRASSWNVRDMHMAAMLDKIVEHVGGPVVVWAHNSHVGDARASEMGDSGEVSLGQLARERFGHDARLVGFTTSTGTVTAAPGWGDTAEHVPVRAPRADGTEALLSAVQLPSFALDLRAPAVRDVLEPRRLERAIGVVYRPTTERVSHYFSASAADRFDLLVHLEETTALAPLEPVCEWDETELPQTYPTAV